MAVDWTARIALLEGMITDGVLESRHGDKAVKFRSLSDLREALAFARAKAAGSDRRRYPRAALVTFGDG